MTTVLVLFKIARRLYRYEPVRVLLGTVLGLLVAVLVAKGIIDSQTSALVLAIAAGVLGIPAIEVARSKVTPQAKVPEVISGQVGAVIDKAARELHLTPESRKVVEALTAQAQNYIGHHRRDA